MRYRIKKVLSDYDRNQLPIWMIDTLDNLTDKQSVQLETMLSKNYIANAWRYLRRISLSN